MSKIQKFAIDQETRSAEMVITAKTPEEAVQIAMERLKAEGLQGCGIAIVTVDESDNAPEAPESNNLTCDCANCKNSDCDNSGEEKEVDTKEDERLGRGNTNPFILSYGLDNGSECPCPACQVMRGTGFTMSLSSPVMNPANTVDDFLREVLRVAKKPSPTPTIIKNRNKTPEEMAISIAQNSMYGSFSIRPVIFEPTVDWEAHVNNFTNVMYGNKGLESVLQEEASQPTFGSVIEEQNKSTVEFIKHTENVFQDVMDELVKKEESTDASNPVVESMIPEPKEQSWEKYVNHPVTPSLVVIPLYGTSRSDFYDHYYNEFSNIDCKIKGSAIDNMTNDFSRILEIIKDIESNGDISDINNLNDALNTAYGRELVWNNIYIRGINANLSPEMRSKKLVTEVISLVFGDELKA